MTDIKNRHFSLEVISTIQQFSAKSQKQSEHCSSACISLPSNNQQQEDTASQTEQPWDQTMKDKHICDHLKELPTHTFTSTHNHHRHCFMIHHTLQAALLFCLIRPISAALVKIFPEVMMCHREDCCSSTLYSILLLDETSFSSTQPIQRHSGIHGFVWKSHIQNAC